MRRWRAEQPGREDHDHEPSHQALPPTHHGPPAWGRRSPVAHRHPTNTHAPLRPPGYPRTCRHLPSRCGARWPTSPACRRMACSSSALRSTTRRTAIWLHASSREH
ncbi:hypothetical protein D187_000369 [Cystobacter fuscus DSM 2262]|uniref:Uncharacterized protein n=1 Tax=Cystobacter fuscus (strain ATCC 25194 / DSM 2262 / NBRC 100088 / M29) TaxID=1242864 RepID=S9QUE4_CYSF2|nr:hypothetical protein D187_000369 [Cystobacter fuscus DSM 2262]